MEVTQHAAIVTGSSRIIAAVGWPTHHLRTPTFFNALCASRDIDALMVPWAVQGSDLKDVLDGLRRVENLAGIVVAIPHKARAALLCDTLEGDAMALKVVNAVRRNENGSFTGRLYDGLAFVEGMMRQGVVLAGKRVLLIGAGGAASAIALALARQGIAALTVTNRSQDKSLALLEQVSKAAPGPDFNMGIPASSGHDVIINATSLGMQESDPLPCDLSDLKDGTVVADVIMQPPVTRFLHEAARRGALAHRGEHMVPAQLDYFLQFLLDQA
ncbi:shikimate dehydrogenase [Caballeronia cordobensis]|uniref:shikimate dehydrogenase family protein n=1 Tax=Caballeronia cordobensis TaxID=1353886 RepID=UPI0005EDC6AC